MQELWKDIKDFEGLYQISNFGNVRSLITNKNIKFNKVKGYLYVHLYNNSKRKSIRVNRLVAQAFIPNPDNKPQVNHIDGDKLNNRVDNLEWVTREENMQHAIKNSLRKPSKGIKNPLSKQIICITTGEIFGSTREAGEKMNADYSRISKCCRGEAKHCGKHPLTGEKLIWEYVEE